MRARLPLRRRMLLAFTALGFILSLLYAAAVPLVLERYEHVMADEILRSRSADLAQRLAENPAAQPLSTRRVQAWLQRRDGSGDAIPPQLQRFSAGTHELKSVEVDDEFVHVVELPQGRLYLMTRLEEVEVAEHHVLLFLLLVITLGTAISGWLGWLLAGATVAPVRRLAAAVHALPTRPQLTQFAQTTADDELGQLGQAIDAYQQRLVAAEEHERAFFADASHELRTPIAVVRGAAEVLLDEPQLGTAMRRRLQRLERGVAELTDLLEVLLRLARRRPLQPERVDMNELLQESARSLHDSATRTLRIAVETAAQQLPREETRLVLGGLLRRLVPPGSGGELRLGAGADFLELHYAQAGAGGGAGASTGRGDSGLVPALVRRLIERLGWTLTEIDGAEGSRTLRLQLGRDSATPD